MKTSSCGPDRPSTGTGFSCLFHSDRMTWILHLHVAAVKQALLVPKKDSDSFSCSVLMEVPTK